MPDFIEILVRNKLLDEAKVAAAKKTARSSNISIADALVKLGFCPVELVTKAKAKAQGLEYVKLEGIDVPPHIVQLVPESIARERGIPVLVDGSQGAVHLPVDVQDIGCDWYVMTGHKLYGPSGIGVLYGKKERLREMRPFQGGGEMIVEVTEDIVTYNEPPHRFEAGTPPIVQAIGLGYALDYMEKIGRAAISAHEADLAAYAYERLSSINSLKMFGTAPGKGSIFSFELEGIHAHDVSMVIDRAGVAVRAGTHCAQPLLKRFGVTSTCRASFGMYNTRAEVDVLADALDHARKFFA